MRWMKWIGIIAAIVLVIACFQPWVIIEWKNITVSGFETTGTNFGKPGYVHFIFSAIFILFTLIRSVLLKRLNLLVTAINLGWAIRNFFIISLCRAGECPEKQIALYIVLFSSVLMLISAMLPDMRVKAVVKE